MSDKPKTMPVYPTDSKTAIRVDGDTFTYPSAVGKGHELVSYERRNLEPKGGPPIPVKIKIRELPGLIVRDLRDAHRKGELRQELGRQLDFLKENQYIDSGSLSILRGYQRDLLGLHEPDADTLQTITGVIESLRPQERPQ